MIDAVLSYHLNPQTCGVARFNQRLAERLGVPCVQIACAGQYRRPLLSMKYSELAFDSGLYAVTKGTSDLFLHDVPDWYDTIEDLAPIRVYAANNTIADAIRPVRPDVIEAFCPSTIQGNPHRGAYRVLTFGMAHKLTAPHFERLKAQLEQEHPDYTVELSCAVHEGSPWDQAMTESANKLRAIFGDKLRVLGYLGDDALAKELHDCDAVALFYEPALRRNNTTYWAAVEAGKTIYTNRDAQSPKEGEPAPTWDALVELIRA